MAYKNLLERTIPLRSQGFRWVLEAHIGPLTVMAGLHKIAQGYIEQKHLFFYAHSRWMSYIHS
jgi:hypothetical protein